MHSLLSLSLLAFSASASFICNDPQREVHVCCESPSPKKIYNGATLAHGQKCELSGLKSHPPHELQPPSSISKFAPRLSTSHYLQDNAIERTGS
ncbi:putative amidase [Venturia inaequalis]|nr:putative amidase [Venturia inaequalis]